MTSQHCVASRADRRRKIYFLGREDLAYLKRTSAGLERAAVLFASCSSGEYAEKQYGEMKIALWRLGRAVNRRWFCVSQACKETSWIV